MLFIGVIGIVFCLLSVIVLGLDLSAFISGSESMHFTRLMEILRVWMPNFWAKSINYINTRPDGATKAEIVNGVLSIPVSALALVLGLLLVIVGFRVRRYGAG